MTWQTVGSITSAAREWTRLPLLLTTGEAFRVLQTWEGESAGDFWVTIRGFYPSGGASGYRRIYPSEEESLIVFPVPDELREVGFVTRYIEAKLNTYARVFGPANWELTLQVWSGDGNPVQILDPGIY